jgi:hypothetical protein
MRQKNQRKKSRRREKQMMCRLRKQKQKDVIQGHGVNQVNVLVECFREVVMRLELQRQKWRAEMPQQQREMMYAWLIVVRDFGVEIVGFEGVRCSGCLVRYESVA